MKQTPPSGTSQSCQLPRQRSTASWTKSERKRGRISSLLLSFSVRLLSRDEGKPGDDDAKQYTDGSVIIQTSAESVFSTPSWFGEVVLLTTHLR